MEKLKKVTRRITAVAATVGVLTSTVFGAGLASYPTNFVNKDKFEGKVVIGADADAAAATSLIADLEKEFSGSDDKVKITYKKKNSGGESIEIADSGKTLNYGEDLNDVKTSSFDDGDSDLLEDESLKLKTTEDYEQTIELADNGVFEHALRDDLDNDISTHVFFKKGDVLSYTLELDSALDTDGYDDDDIVGEKITIMGNEFTIGDDYGISDEGTADGFDKLKLIGGANKVSLGEGETTTVSLNGKDYEIAVDSVSDTKVLLSVNGQSESIDNYESEEVAGITLAVTDLVESSRDSVKGYAEFVVGGQEILLEDGKEVKINDEKISDLIDDYKVTATFKNTNNKGFDGFTLTYSWENSDGFMLNEGDSFDDKVFQAFRIEYDGTNDVEYSELKIESSGEKIKLDGKTVEDEDFSEEIAYALNKGSETTPVRLIGGDEDVPMFVNSIDFADGTAAAGENDVDVEYIVKSDASTTTIVNSSTLTGTAGDYLVYTEKSGTKGFDGNDEIIFIGSNSKVDNLFVIGANHQVTGIKAGNSDDGVRFLTGDDDNQQLYEISSFDESDDEFDFEDILTGNTKTEVSGDQVGSKLDDLTFEFTGSSTDLITEITNTESSGKLAFENEVLVDLSGLNVIEAEGAKIVVEYDEGDLDVDDSGDAHSVTIELGKYDKSDEEFVFNLKDSDFATLTSGAESDISESDDDTQEFVTTYGTKVIYDAEDKQSVKIMTPDEQVEAKVNLVFGGSAAEEKTVIVDSSELEDKKKELKDDGYTIVDTEEIEAVEAEFDVTGAVMDSEVSGTENMIVVGGPAVNAVARELLGITEYSVDQAGVNAGEGVIKYFEDKETVLVYGYTKEDTAAAVEKLNAGGLSGTQVNVQ